MIGDLLRTPPEPTLSRYTRNLTAEARAGRLDPVRCRAAEIDRVIDVLLRHGKNNPVLTGPAGVGKTAIVEGLAQRIVEGRMPAALRDARIMAVDHMALLGGTMYRGQYEQRMESLVKEATAAPDVILFVDELHNLVGQGTAQGVPMDAGNMLKPALTRGDFRVIGATTTEEYDRWICSDPALERRFQRVEVRELSAEETREILRARRAVFERHHGVLVADDALEAALKLTDKYIIDRMRPDRAIDALDEACAHMQATIHHGPRVDTLLGERRHVIAAREKADGQADGAPNGAGRAGAKAPNGSADASADDESASDRIERFRREGMAALERFGAELDSFFGVPREPEPAPHFTRPAGARAARPAAPDGTADDAGPLPPRAPRLAEIEAELAPLLAAEGAVVRGVDVARAVSNAVGTNVKWP